MRKYVIWYTRQAYEERKIDHNNLISGIACYGLKELKETIKNISNDIGLLYIENEIDILSGDGSDAYQVGTKLLNKLKI